MRERQREDFLEVKTPLLYSKKLWEQSGHWGKYRENMFLALDNESERARHVAQAHELPRALAIY